MRLEWTAVALFVVNVLLLVLRGRVASRPTEPDPPVGPVVQAMVEEVEREGRA